MAKNNDKAFSLAEMMVVLFVVTLVLSASVPVITKRTKLASSVGTTTSIGLWSVTPTNSDKIYYGTDADEAVAVGIDEFDLADNGRFLINTQDYQQNHILFREVGASTPTGRLQLQSGDTVILDTYQCINLPRTNSTAVGYTSSKLVSNNSAVLGNSLSGNNLALIRGGVSVNGDTAYLSSVLNIYSDRANIRKDSHVYNSPTSNSIQIGYKSNSYHSNSIVLGYWANASNAYTANNKIAIGMHANCLHRYGPGEVIGSNSDIWLNSILVGSYGYSHENSTSAGYNTNAFNDSVVLGYGANAWGDSSISFLTTSLGYEANICEGTAIGYKAGGHSSSVAIGSEANTSHNDVMIGSAVFVGSGASLLDRARTIQMGCTSHNSSNTYSISLGSNAKAYTNYAIAAGYNTNAYGSRAIATGSEANACGANALALGYKANAYGTNAIAIGNEANAYGVEAAAIGDQANASYDYSMAIGTGAVTTETKQIVIGTSDTNVYIPGEIWTAVGGNITTSDKRLKNIKGSFKSGLKKIRKLKPYNFIFKDDKKKRPQVGVIAQDLRKVFPNSVVKGSDGYLGIRQEEMFYAMINAIKELDNMIQKLTQKVTFIAGQIKSIESNINNIFSLISTNPIENQRIQIKYLEEKISKLEKELN